MGAERLRQSGHSMSEVFDLDLPVHKRRSTAAHPVEEAKQMLELAAVRCVWSTVLVQVNQSHSGLDSR